ncbi:MAG: YgfZ/GcvT domain-containing protein [Arenimonas sp.]
MSDKLNFSTASLSRLQSFSLLTLEGPDAVAFIQAQSMNDVKALVDGQWHWNGLLNPKGRLIALFALVRIRADLLYLLLPDFSAEKLAQHLQGFVFRSKVRLVFDTDKFFAAEFDFQSSPGLERDFTFGELEHGFSLDFSSDASTRRLWVLPTTLAANVPHDLKAESDWRDADLMHGLPRLSEAQTELWTPQMLCLERLNALSLKKGCYPGQEIVARTHYLGQAKRQARLVQAEHLSVGVLIYRAEEKIGEVICVAARESVGLAILQNIADSDLLVCDENEVKPLQALTGLQRPV